MSWPFDSDVIYVGVPWHDEGEDWDEVRGTAEVVEHAASEELAKAEIMKRTHAEWVQIVEFRRPT